MLFILSLRTLNLKFDSSFHFKNFKVWRRPAFGSAGPLGGNFPLVTIDGHHVLDVIFTSPILDLGAGILLHIFTNKTQKVLSHISCVSHKANHLSVSYFVLQDNAQSPILAFSFSSYQQRFSFLFSFYMLMITSLLSHFSPLSKT
jgi:hypothetical protein